MFVGVAIATCRFGCAIYTHQFLEMFDERMEIVKQRLLPESHTQQQAFDLLGHYLFTDSRLLAIDSQCRSPQLVQPTVDFDSFGTFTFDTPRHPQRTWCEHLGAEYAFRPADSQSPHDRTMTLCIRFVRFEVERHLYILLIHNSINRLQN